MASEFEFIKHIRRQTEKRNHRATALTCGIGDDAAILKQYANRDTVITTDLLVEDVDFRREWMPPRLLGHKALAVSLSDIAAMGARPRFALLSIGVPQKIWRSKFLEQFYEGFFALADCYKVLLIGGDVSRTPERIVIDSIVIGETQRGQTVSRAEARAGDLIFVTGTLGGASCGMQLLEAGARLPKNLSEDAQTSARDHVLLRHLRPQPRVAWSARLGKERLATAMIDVSDGLSSDLTHLCRESNVGADIEASCVPVDPLILKACGAEIASSGLLNFALNGGEDFELLFTVRPRDAVRLPKRIGGVSISQIGVITKTANRIRLIGNKRSERLRPAGFVHFNSGR